MGQKRLWAKTKASAGVRSWPSKRTLYFDNTITFKFLRIYIFIPHGALFQSGVKIGLATGILKIIFVLHPIFFSFEIFRESADIFYSMNLHQKELNFIMSTKLVIFTHFPLGEESTMSFYIRFLSTCFYDRSYFLWQKLLSVTDFFSMTDTFFCDQNFFCDRNVFLWEKKLGQKLVSVTETCFLW